MRYDGLESLLGAKGAIRPGPLALVLAEDRVALEPTLRHLLGLGFGSVLCLAPKGWPVPGDLAERVICIEDGPRGDGALIDAVNTAIRALPGRWIHYCYNAEFLFFPFCETRSIGEMLAFHAEERRHAMLTYVIDLYAKDLARFPDAVSLEEAYFDRSGYYALARSDPARPGAMRERQLDVFGGLRWRFEDHVPADRRRIDRIALFRAAPGLRLRADHTLSDEECNTYACPWHNSLTAALASFRTAKALKRNPGSTFDIHTFSWQYTTRFDWHSQQLLDLGLMEPGQWF